MGNAQKLNQTTLESLLLTKHSAGFGHSNKSECFGGFVFPVCLSPTKCLGFLFGSEVTAMGEGQKGLRLWNVCSKERGNAVRSNKAWAWSLWEAGWTQTGFKKSRVLILIRTLTFWVAWTESHVYFWFFTYSVQLVTDLPHSGSWDAGHSFFSEKCTTKTRSISWPFSLSKEESENQNSDRAIRKTGCEPLALP